jgi:hypothetical protein
MKYRFELTEEAVLDLLKILNQDMFKGKYKYGGARIEDNKVIISGAHFVDGEVLVNKQAVVLTFQKIEETSKVNDDEEYLGYR